MLQPGIEPKTFVWKSRHMASIVELVDFEVNQVPTIVGAHTHSNPSPALLILLKNTFMTLYRRTPISDCIVINFAKREISSV